MRTDAHVYLGQSLFGFTQTVEEILGRLRQVEISCAVLCPVKPRGYHLAPENDRVAEAVRRYPGCFIGFVRVDPRLGEEALAEMVRGIEKLGLQGLYLDPWEETFAVNAEFVYPFLARAEAYGVPVMVRGGFPLVSHPTQIADMAQRFPRTMIIATSGGQINVSGGLLAEAKNMLLHNGNVFLETSGIYRQDFIEEMAERLGNHRIIYGSGSPLLDMRLEVQRIRRAHLPESAIEMMLGENLARLLAQPNHPHKV